MSWAERSTGLSPAITNCCPRTCSAGLTASTPISPDIEAQIEADLTRVHLTGVQAGHAGGPWQLVMPSPHRPRQQHQEFFTEAVGSSLEKLVTVTAASLAAGIWQLSGSRQYVPRSGSTSTRGIVGGADSTRKILGYRLINRFTANSPTQLVRKYRSGVLMPCLSRQCGVRTTRLSDQSEFVSTGDLIAVIVHTQLRVCTLGAFLRAPPSSDNRGTGVDVTRSRCSAIG